MKILLMIALLILATASSRAQGYVTFLNGQITFASVADRLVYFTTGDPGGPPSGKLVGTNFVAGLYYLPGANQNLQSPTAGTQAGALAMFRAPTTSLPGVWFNGAVGNVRYLDGVAVGGLATLQVRVWDITKYGTFAQAFAAGEYGWSQPFLYRAPTPYEPNPLSYMENLRAFVVYIPEPSALALGGFGLLGLLALRRRR
jgi:hypothetical protein